MPHISASTLEAGERLLRLQLELECTRVEPGNLLAPFACADPDPLARALVVGYSNAYALYLRQDMPLTLRERLRELGPERALSDRERVQAILAEDATCDDVWSGVTYIFPSNLAATVPPDAIRLEHQRHGPLLDAHQPGWDVGKGVVYGIIVDGRLVSSCTSSRENAQAAEAWVVTKLDYRRRGFARQVVAAWARDLQQQGKTPFYSHRADNLASRDVAHSLGLAQVFATVGYS